MLDKWVFALGAALIILAEVQYFYVLREQLRQFQTKSDLQPLKKLLFATVILLMLGAMPLLMVYINLAFLHWQALWIVYLAVVANSLSKVATGTMLILIYRFRAADYDDI